MDYQHRYPLHHAINCEDLEEVQRLSEVSCYLMQENTDGDTPLNLITIYSKYNQKFAIQAVECLLKAGVHPDRITDLSKLPLHQAIKSNQLELVRLFLQYGADPNKRDNDIKFRDYKGNNSIHCVINLDNLISEDYKNKILKLLFMHPDIQLNEKNSLGEEFLDYLVYKIVLLKYAYKSYHWTPLETNVLWNAAVMIESLILAGFDPEKSSLYYPGMDSKTFTYLEGDHQSVLQSQIEKNYEQLQAESDLISEVPYNQAVLIRVIQEEVYPFLREIIEEALKLKEAETAKLGNIKDPQIIKQFLLASEKEKTSLLKKKQQLQFAMALEEEKAQEHPAEEVRLKRLDGAITARFLFSSVTDRKEFLFQIRWLDRLCATMYDEKDKDAQDYFQKLRKNVPLLAAALTFPEEVFRIILKYLLPNPNRMFLFVEESMKMSRQQPAEISEPTNTVSPRMG